MAELNFKDLASNAKSHVIDAMDNKGFETLQKQVTTSTSKSGFKVLGTDGVYWANFGRPSEAELGRETKLPPANAISDWMTRKGIDLKYLYPIRRKIKVFGTKGHFYLAEPLQQIIDEVSNEVGDQMIAKIKLINTNDYNQNT